MNKKLNFTNFINLESNSKNSQEMLNLSNKAYNWILTNFDDLISKHFDTKNFVAIIIIMNTLKTILLLETSPNISILLTTMNQTWTNSKNILLIITIAVLSFSIFIQVSFVDRNPSLHSITQIFTNIMRNIFGSIMDFNLNDSPNSEITSIGFVAFLWILKILTIYFLLAITKVTFIEISVKFSKFKKLGLDRWLDDCFKDYLKYSLFPISLYFIYKDYKYYKEIYKDVDNEKVVNENDIKCTCLII